MTHDFINRSDWKDNFSVLPNALINDDRVNAEGLALLVYLLSKPADWKVNVTNIRNRFGWGRDKSYKVIAHLEQLGYISRWNDRDGGKFGSTAYYVYDAPCTEKPYTEKPYPVNQEHTKDRDIQRTDVTNQNKGRGKEKLVDWMPTDEDRAYATELGLDADELLADIRLWDEQNGNKAAYASLRAFWQGWCRREAKRRPRALKRDYGANGKSWEQRNWSPGEKKPLTATEWRVMNEGMKKWYRLNRPDAIEQLKAEGVEIA